MTTGMYRKKRKKEKQAERHLTRRLFITDIASLQKLRKLFTTDIVLIDHSFVSEIKLKSKTK